METNDESFLSKCLLASSVCVHLLLMLSTVARVVGWVGGGVWCFLVGKMGRGDRCIYIYTYIYTYGQTASPKNNMVDSSVP